MPPHGSESPPVLGGDLPATSLPIYNTSATTSSNKRKMAPGSEFEDSGDGSKKGKGQASHPFHNAGPWNPPNTESPFSKPFPNRWPNANPSLLSSTVRTNSPTTISPHNPTWKAPDSKAIEKKLNDLQNDLTEAAKQAALAERKATEKKLNSLQNALTEATKRAALAERKAAEYLEAKDNAERQLQDCNAGAATLFTANQQLTAENQSLSSEFKKLEKHTKNCEKATNKAQKEAQHAKGLADHMVNSQKGQLKSAERRYEAAARDLKEWTEKYGFVERPAEKKAALQKRLSEWQSKAEKARNEIAALKEVLQGQQGIADTEEIQPVIKAEETPRSIKAEEDPRNTGAERNRSTAAAEAKAAKRQEERDTLHRMLQEEMARNAKLAESLVLRNAKLAESLGRPGEDGRSWEA